MQFKRLQPWDIKKVMHLIRPVLLLGAPPTAEKSQEGINRIVAALVSGVAQCWVLYQKGEEDELAKVYCILLTVMQTEPITGGKYLLVYGIYGYRKLEPEMWDVMLERVEVFAKGQGCNSITAISIHPMVTKRCSDLGFQQLTLLYKEV